MPGFLSEEQKAQIAAAVKGTTDTFFEYPITLLKRTAKLSAFNEGRAETTTTTPYELRGMKLPESTGSDSGAKLEVSRKGTADLTAGVLYVNYEDLRAAGLIGTAGEVLINPATDTLQDGAHELIIEAAPPVGPLGTAYALVKLMYKKKLTRG